MATSTLAHVTPPVLRWARESIGYTVEDAAAKIGVRVEKLEGAESGELLLTLRQAEKAASVYDRPLAALFLPEPPSEEPQDAQFRRLPGAPEPPWPPEMQILVRRVSDRQEAAVELHEALDEQPAWPAIVNDLAAVGRPLPELARHLLGVGFEEQTNWRDSSGYVPLRHWIDAVESLGILVMQDGSLPVDLMRGFAAMHAQVPAIVINAQDDARARVFTLIHELGHLYLVAIGGTPGRDTEPWCDDFAGEVLMPRGWMENVLTTLRHHTALDTIDLLALTFGVTPYAAAVRVARAELMPRDIVDGVIEEIRSRPPRSRGPGGDYYWTQIGRLGPSYIRLVLTALDSQAVTYPVASTLLDGVKVNNFEKLRDYVVRRTELG